MTWCSLASTISAAAAFPACWRFRRLKVIPSSRSMTATPVPRLLQNCRKVRLDAKINHATGETVMSPAEARLNEVPSGMTDAEWDQRINLAACYRLVAYYGWDDLVDTHISARVPGPEHHFLINPYGLMFDEITASSLVKVGLDGNKAMESPYAINPAGFTIHSAVHAAREDAICVMHLHTRHGVAISAKKHGLLPISQQSLFALASIAYHDYEGLALNDEEKPRLVTDLGDKNNLILRNHGLLTIGSNAAE